MLRIRHLYIIPVMVRFALFSVQLSFAFDAVMTWARVLDQVLRAEDKLEPGVERSGPIFTNDRLDAVNFLGSSGPINFLEGKRRYGSFEMLNFDGEEWRVLSYIQARGTTRVSHAQGNRISSFRCGAGQLSYPSCHLQATTESSMSVSVHLNASLAAQSRLAWESQVV